MREYGIFNPEGLIEGQFYSHDEAERAIADRYSDDDEAHVSEVCPDHEEQERANCEECAAEEEED